MKPDKAKELIKETFEQPFFKDRFVWFLKNLFPDKIEFRNKVYAGNYIKEAYRAYIRKYEQVGKFEDDEGNTIDLLTVELLRGQSVERARTSQRNFIAQYLKNKNHREGALVAFYSEGNDDWRFSFIKMEYSLEKKKDDLTPAKRFSFLVGKDEKSHTAQNQLTGLLTMQTVPLMQELEQAFNIETVTKEFFEKYKQLFLDLNDHIEKEIKKSKPLHEELESKNIDSASFTKKLLGQIVFLYFLQKKGWLGVPKDENWGKGDKRFLRSLLDKAVTEKENFFADYLVYLFYEALATEHRGGSDSSYYKKLDCRIPFLNGGLFEADYNWEKITVDIPNKFFTNRNKTKEGDEGDGILDVFDRYNFTVKEDEPLEKEVAVDPEMLGKVFENLLEIKDRKSKGAFYTPREIVHYMCQESLIAYLDTSINCEATSFQKLGTEQTDMFGNKARKGQLPLEVEHGSKIKVERKNIEIFIREGITTIEHDAAKEAGKLVSKDYGLPESIRENAKELDKALANIRICDPAIGSGAFPVGMMNEIVKAREILATFLPESKTKSHTPYELKRHAIQECIYGVDIDHSAIDIAKLRLWLSLVVDEDDFHKIKPLPNLDYKIMCANSLIGLPDGVVKNDLAENDLENLKEKYFGETDLEKKMKLRKEIDKTRDKLISSANEFLSYKVKFDFKLFFSEVFHEKKGFDVILANPPYIGEKGNKDMFQELRESEFGKKYYDRRMDLFYFFFHKAIDLATPKGIISFITTNYYITATYAKKLRKDIYDRTTPLKFIDFNEFKIFDSARGQHNLITILSKEKPTSDVKIAYTERKGYFENQILQNILNWNDSQTIYTVTSKDLIFDGLDYYIRFGVNHSDSNNSNDIDKILDKVYLKKNFVLGQICDIEQGIVSGADKVSDKIISDYPKLNLNKGDGIFILNHKEVKSLNLNEEEKLFIKPTYKNSDVRKWYFTPSKKLFVLYLKDEGLPIKLGNNLKAHFEKYKPILVGKKMNCFKNVWLKKIVEPWLKRGNYFVLFYPRNRKTFDSIKIVNSRRAMINSFSLEDRRMYEQSDLVITTLKSQFNGEIDIKYILAILNSKLYYNWFYRRGKRKGKQLELFQKPLSEVPIKIFNQKSFITLVDKILEAKKQDPNANTTGREKQLDIMVYHLYNLTYEEARIIDPGLSEEEFAKYKNVLQQ